MPKLYKPDIPKNIKWNYQYWNWFFVKPRVKSVVSACSSSKSVGSKDLSSRLVRLIDGFSIKLRTLTCRELFIDWFILLINFDDFIGINERSTNVNLNFKRIVFL